MIDDGESSIYETLESSITHANPICNCNVSEDEKKLHGGCRHKQFECPTSLVRGAKNVPYLLTIKLTLKIWTQNISKQCHIQWRPQSWSYKNSIFHRRWERGWNNGSSVEKLQYSFVDEYDYTEHSVENIPRLMGEGISFLIDRVSPPSSFPSPIINYHLFSYLQNGLVGKRSLNLIKIVKFGPRQYKESLRLLENLGQVENHICVGKIFSLCRFILLTKCKLA